MTPQALCDHCGKRPPHRVRGSGFCRLCSSCCDAENAAQAAKPADETKAVDVFARGRAENAARERLRQDGILD